VRFYAAVTVGTLLGSRAEVGSYAESAVLVFECPSRVLGGEWFGEQESLRPGGFDAFGAPPVEKRSGDADLP
jgi:hypothetical protein